MKTSGLFKADFMNGRVLDCELSQNDKRPCSLRPGWPFDRALRKLPADTYGGVVQRLKRCPKILSLPSLPYFAEYRDRH